MDFLKRVYGAAQNAVQSFTNPYKIQEVNSKNYDNSSLVCKEGLFALYKMGKTYDAIVHFPEQTDKAFSLFRLEKEMDALSQFTNLQEKLNPLVMSSHAVLQKDKLQELIDCLRENPTWSCAHLATQLGLKNSLRHPSVLCFINAADPKSGLAPIHLAVKSNMTDLVKELVVCQAQTSLIDALGNTAYHYAAVTNRDIIRILATRDIAKVVNTCNGEGETPLHIAALHNKDECLDELLIHGADPMLTNSYRFPIHCATKNSNIKCIEILVKRCPNQLTMQDSKYGGAPIHWAKTKETVALLADLGCDTNARNFSGDTPLHIMIQRKRVECIVELLSRGADANAIGYQGNTLLHLALLTEDVDVVRSIIVFGCDVNAANSFGVMPRHIAANSSSKSRDALVYCLHMVGALRCREGMQGCSDGCKSDGKNDGKPDGKPAPPPDEPVMLHEEMLRDALEGTASFNAWHTSIDLKQKAGLRVLSLDGGGIRGLVLIQILLAIEQAAGKPIREMFDWFAGTSTGGILALAILHGKTLRYTMGLYFRLKSQVFVGGRPYNSEKFESFLKQEFGENTKMTDVTEPKVMVTGVLADRHPAELHLFRNYVSPRKAAQSPSTSKPTVDTNNFEPVKGPHEQPVWRAARCTGAAPTYFRAMGRFLDGGLIANNPTLDLLTEIWEYNMALKFLNQESKMRPLGLVVSLGTGRIPVTPVSNCDVFRPGGPIDLVKLGFGAQALTNLLIDQATQAEGRVVDRCRAWCAMVNIPFFRFSPQLSDDISLDATEDTILCRMLWDTQVYLYQNREKINHLARVLTSLDGGRKNEGIMEWKQAVC
ncbi:85/88 kDa calcium-independent phospholipase A2-like [Lingula anatina]|uniref:phospholipase A2 n=1 Tax=Lingula anatina TaxID=7574 RepID=A0A1S3IBL0_LINAN|nr:85/88 kDa calcium-independent phospholipase A2-like [Lingula anatina]|eukprot:XP_013395642.1 85/88 kDa calcium-independent phospholipase A2-like [Lingula anatina]